MDAVQGLGAVPDFPVGYFGVSMGDEVRHPTSGR
jgi:hypothetical protein